MSRRRHNTQDNTMAGIAADIFKIAPLWLGPFIAAGIFALLWFAPAFLAPAPNDQLYTPFMHMLATVTGTLLLFAWAIITLLRIFSRK